MLGKNTIRIQDLKDSGILDVVEVFYTIQGEGPFSGMPAVFVRLAGCNLRCRFCDTDFESNSKAILGEDLAKKVIKLAKNKTRLVVITGGEPLLQNIIPFLDAMRFHSMKIQIETAGTVWVPGLDRFGITYVCSPKSAKVHPLILKHCKDYKYIFGTGDHYKDGLLFSATQTNKGVNLFPAPANTNVWIQPRDDHNTEKNQKNLELARNLCLKTGYRLSIQLHKIAGVP